MLNNIRFQVKKLPETLMFIVLYLKLEKTYPKINPKLFEGNSLHRSNTFAWTEDKKFTSTKSLTV